MADEAVCLEAPRIIKRVKVTDIQAIAKGTLLQLSNADFYVLPSDATTAGQVFGGIAIEEKTANDGIVEIGAAFDGGWDIKAANATIAYGAMVVLSGANLVRLAVEADFPLGRVFGRTKEAASAAEVVKINLGLNN